MITTHQALTEIQAEVLSYLEEHPAAFDTIDGIRQWWLLQRMDNYSRKFVHQALCQLVSAHLIQQRVLDDGTEVFGLRRNTDDAKYTDDARSVGA